VGFQRAVTTQLAATAARDLVDECGEVSGSVQIAIQHEAALAAGVGAVGQAQFGFTTPQPEHVLELGYHHLFAMCTRTPDQPVLYST
jgi:hypothetical protein